MSVTPPARRRIHPAVTIRRAQSERRYLSPWQVQVAWPPPPPVYPRLLQGDVIRGSTWVWVDHHHHAPRTALIPPANAHQTRMFGHPQTVFVDAGSVRYRPPATMPCAQLPPLALGAPPILPPLTLEERLAQDRLTAFLAGETLPHRPRSILSCPESPLYESLLSCFTEPEDTITLPDTEGEHEYQQIQVLNAAARSGEQGDGKMTGCESRDKGSNGHESSAAAPEAPLRHSQKTPLTKLNTLDVKPERHNKESEAVDDSRYTRLSRKEVLDSSPSGKRRKDSTQSVSSQESQKSAIYTLSSHSGENTSVVSDADTYQELSEPSTVIYVSNGGNKNALSAESSQSFESIGKKSSTKHSGNLSGTNNHHVSTQVNIGSSSCSSKTSHRSVQPPSRSGSADAATQVEMTKRTKPSPPPPTPAFFPPPTIELPETRSTGWKYEQSISAKKPNPAARRNEPPYIITTLDPPIKRPPRKHHKHTASSSHDPRPVDTSPLAVNFDSEDIGSEEDTIYDFDSCWSTAGESTSLYMADSDTSSLYSSVGEIYSMFVMEPDALVYVYRPPPRPADQAPHRSSTLSYRFPSYAVTSGIGSCGGSSESESSWGGTVSFVEPSYRPSNLSVGSKGHLKIDYSCSWNHLDDFVRTTSPKDGCYGCSEDYRLNYGSRSPRDPVGACMTAPAALLSPWERYSDTAAG